MEHSPKVAIKSQGLKYSCPYWMEAFNRIAVENMVLDIEIGRWLEAHPDEPIRIRKFGAPVRTQP